MEEKKTVYWLCQVQVSTASDCKPAAAKGFKRDRITVVSAIDCGRGLVCKIYSICAGTRRNRCRCLKAVRDGPGIDGNRVGKQPVSLIVKFGHGTVSVTVPTTKPPLPIAYNPANERATSPNSPAINCAQYASQCRTKSAALYELPVPRIGSKNKRKQKYFPR